MNKTFSTSEAYKFAWDKFKSNWKYWLIAYFIVFGASSKFDMSGINDLSKNTTSTQNPNSVLQQRGSQYNRNNVLGTADELLMPVDDEYTNSVTAPGSKADGIMKTPSFLDQIKPWLAVIIPYAVITFILFIVVALIALAVSTILQMGFIHLTIDVAREKPFNFTTILSDVNVKKGLKLFLVDLVYMLYVGLGLLFFVIPGIYLAYKYIFARYIFIDQNTSIGESFKKSAELTKGIKFKLLGFSLVSLLIVILGFVLFMIGVIPATITVMLATAYIYAKLADTTVQPVAQQSTSL